MKLMPASCDRVMMRSDVAASVGPPNVIVPRHSGETLSPLRPRLRYSMPALLQCLALDLSSPAADGPHAASLLPALRLGIVALAIQALIPALLAAEIEIAARNRRHPPPTGGLRPLPHGDPPLFLRQGHGRLAPQDGMA